MTILPPGPKSSLLGLEHAQEFRQDPLGYAFQLRQDFGDAVLLKIGPVNWVLLSHPDYVKEILVTRSKEFAKSEQFKRIIRSVDGNGLVASEGDFWLKQRRTIQPTFGHDKLSQYAQIMAAKVSNYLKRWQPAAQVDIAQEMTNMTLAVSAKLFLGVDVEGREQEIGDAVTTVSQAMYREFTDLLPLPDWLPLPTKLEKRQAVATIDRLCLEGIAQQKSCPSASSMLGLLLATGDTESGGTRMSDAQVLAEAKTMFNGGHDSTAAALAWSWYLLLTNAKTYEKLLQQTEQIAPAGLSGFGDFGQATYSRQVAKEALRLYPPAWLLPRQTLANTTVGRYTVPKGTSVNLIPYLIQRDERFFPAPDTFDPERFNAENEPQQYPFSWFPFGAGPRSCIGREFALLEMQIIMTLVTQKYRLELVPEQKAVQMRPLISLEPKGPIRVSLIPR